MLLGEFRHSLDAKGRVFVPSRWREELAETVVIAKGLDGCLYLMTKARFEEISNRVGELSLSEVGRHYSRILFSGASEEQIDKQGRVTVPPSLRQYAGLGREVVLAGVSGRAEIWDPAAWSEYQERIQSQYEEIAEKLEMEVRR